MSSFDHVQIAPPDAIFHILDRFKSDKSDKKVNLSVGAYRTEEGLPWVLPVVRTIEAQMCSDPMLDHEYLPIDGLKAFVDASSKLVLGSDSQAIVQNRYCGVQALSGTGSLRLGMEFLRKYVDTNTVYISSPTWPNHRGISINAGFTDIKEYRYFNKHTNGIDMDGLVDDLTEAPEHSIIILHTCAHNPTGVDPTRDEWKQIFTVLKERKLFPVLDTAYLGYATGDIDSDAWPVRELVRLGFEFFVAQSFSKNFGLYNERVGQLCCVLASSEVVDAVRSQLKIISRRLWSNPPNHGARIVATALCNPTLFQEWIDNLNVMTTRVKTMRDDLYQRLKALGAPGDWSHIINQIGMFSYTGLTAEQVDYITKKYHIYLLPTGRINICGLNPSNLDYVAEAIHDATTSVPAH